MHFGGLGLVLMSCSGGLDDLPDPPAPPGATTASTATGSTLPSCENEGDVLDLRQDYASAPEQGIEIRTPSFEVPPYSEVFWCLWGTYDGPTVGVDYYEPLHQREYNHHNLLRNVTGEAEPDGTFSECPPTDSMYQYTPIFEPVGVEPNAEVTNWLELPDGVAVRFQEGQKWMMDVHYINPTGCTLIVDAGSNFGTVPESEVEQWAGSVRLDGGIVELPPGESTTIEFECEWPQQMTVLSVGSHMHEHGTSFEVDHTDLDGATERIYEIEDWEPEYRDFPVMENFEPGELELQVGESLTTTCNYFNSTDSVVTWPDEMCNAMVVGYPLDAATICMLGEFF